MPAETKSLLARGYFENRTGYECTNASICNCLGLMGHVVDAERFYDAFRNNRWIGKTGVWEFLVPQVIREVSGFIWTAEVVINKEYLGDFEGIPMPRLKRVLGAKAEEARDIMRKEIRWAIRLSTEQMWAYKNVPAVLNISLTDGRSPGGPHAVALTDDSRDFNRIIDDGWTGPLEKYRHECFYPSSILNLRKVSSS
jgi:hypothetical protein